MAKTNTELSIEILYRLAQFLNQEIEQNGRLTKDNKRIWDGWLHQMDNEVWRGCIETMLELHQQHPELFKLKQYTDLVEGLQLLNRYDQYYDKVMDMRNRHVSAKGVAWKCMLTMREVWNTAVGIDIPNADTSRVTSQFSQIFA